MTLEHRPVIKEGDHLVVTRHNRRVQLSAHDLADHIAHRHEISARPDERVIRRHAGPTVELRRLAIEH